MTKKKPKGKEKSAAGRKGTRRAKVARRSKASRTKTRSSVKPIATTRKRSPRLLSIDAAAGPERRVRRSRSAGQSGDIQGLSSAEQADSESVEELIEEGQAFEAGIVSGVEDADAGQGEVRAKEVPEDDVPPEYLQKD